MARSESPFRQAPLDSNLATGLPAMAGPFAFHVSQVLAFRRPAVERQGDSHGREASARRSGHGRKPRHRTRGVPRAGPARLARRPRQPGPPPRRAGRGRAGLRRSGCPAPRARHHRPASVRALSAWLDRELGGVDVLVNNAAVLLEEDGEVLHIAEETFRVSFDTNVLVNAVDPGWVRTDRGGSSAPRSPAQGADTIVWCATLPDGGPSGGFFRDRRAIPW